MENRRERVVLEYDGWQSYPASKEYFGIQCLSDITSISESKESHAEHLIYTLQISSYSEFVHRITDRDRHAAMVRQSHHQQESFSEECDDEVVHTSTKCPCFRSVADVKVAIILMEQDQPSKSWFKKEA